MGDILTVKFYVAFTQIQHPEGRLHCGRFTRAVRANNHCDLALLYTDGAVVQYVRGAVASGHIFANQETHQQLPFMFEAGTEVGLNNLFIVLNFINSTFSQHRAFSHTNDGVTEAGDKVHVVFDKAEGVATLFI